LNEAAGLGQYSAQPASGNIGRKRLRVIVSLFAVLTWVVSAAAYGGDPRVERVLIDKSERKLVLLNGEQPLRTYSVALGAAPKGAKQFEGDQRTPEGVYTIDYRNAASAFHLALRISYPNEADRVRALESGMDPGGQIMIHGLKNGQGWLGERHLADDWTDGCIAVTNAEIEEIWSLVELGTPVEIRP
jgi:murein L,D-transpeptidase YafK|tara:strand:- start:1401 stop:1964 length:564 start_codon:yes stop_codon:yes gene_type:complete